MSPELLDDLDRRLDEVAAAPELRAVVLTGAGGLAQEVDAFALALTTADQREGMGAFFEKRPLKFA